ncbi:hypothetical protein Taro_023421 [Colocasia esculenta]|uniref:Uncharacterized protein n=1 Tax=Colocasia esculenta TaxID=4460 RepID=A0A843VHC0_COLES|nr:hypothetical protein [Colocasia esculenta]
MVRGRCVTSSGGRGEGSGRRFSSFSTPPPSARGPTTSTPLPSTTGPTTSADLPLAAGPMTSAPLPLAAGTCTSCNGSVDTPTAGVDTRHQSLKKIHEDGVHCVDIVPGSVDTRPSLQKSLLPYWDSVSTQPVSVLTLEPSPRRPVLWNWDSVSTHPMNVSTHSGNFFILSPTWTRPTTSASPSQIASGSTSSPSDPVHVDDETSHHEGEGSYSETMRAVWIHEGNKIEPTQASQFITKTIQAHFLGPIHRFSNFSMDVQDLLYDMFMRNHRFIKRSDELRTRFAWTTIARANFKHLQRNAEKETQLKRPPQFQKLFDQTHKKKGTNNYISEKARKVAVTSDAPKKGHMYGFGHSLGTARVISSCSSSVSHATSPFTTPTAPGGSSSAAPTMTPDQFREIVNEIVSQNISHIVSQTVS